MAGPVKSVGSFFSHAFAAPGSGAGAPNIPAPPPTAPPAQQPTAKPGKKTTQQSFFSGAAMAQQQGTGASAGKTLVGS